MAKKLDIFIVWISEKYIMRGNFNNLEKKIKTYMLILIRFKCSFVFYFNFNFLVFF